MIGAQLWLRGLFVAPLFVAASAGIFSCATLFEGSTQTIAVNSDPPGATVTFNTGVKKVTPFSIEVPRNRDLQLHFGKPGYAPVNLSDNARVDPLGTLDMVPLMLPWLVDAADGAGFEHQESTITAHLDPEPGSAPSSSKRIGVPSPAATP